MLVKEISYRLQLLREWTADYLAGSACTWEEATRAAKADMEGMTGEECESIFKREYERNTPC